MKNENTPEQPFANRDITPGQLGMWIFISTEIMLFAAIVTTYLIFRLSTLESDWPGPSVMHVSLVVGIINTAILVLSGVSAWATQQAAKEDRPASAKLWLILTILLGCTFLGIKSSEYYDKYKLGLLPVSRQKQLHNQADYTYLANVKKRLNDSIAALESKVANEGTGSVENGTERSVNNSSTGELNENHPAGPHRERLELLYSLKKYMADRTSTNAGRTATTYYSLLSVSMMAWQIYPHAETGRNVEVVLEPEFDGLQRGLASYRERLQLIDRRRQMVTQQIQEIDAALESFRLLAPTGDDAVAFEKQKSWLETKKNQQQELIVETKRIESIVNPMQGRLDNLMSTFAEEGALLGVNERHDLRLPVVIPSGQAWMSCYLLLTGTHALHLIAGLLAMLWWLPRKLNSSRAPALFVTCMYWQFMDAVWLGIFWFVYL